MNRSPSSISPPCSTLRDVSAQLAMNTGNSTAAASPPMSGTMPMMKKMMSITRVSTIHMPAARTNSAQASLHHSTPRPAATLRPEPALPMVLVVCSISGPSVRARCRGRHFALAR